MSVVFDADLLVRCVLVASTMVGIVVAVVRSLRPVRAARPLQGAALAIAAMVVALPAAAEDLSKYRNVEFGSSLATVARLTGVDAAQARILQTRPASVQELDWRPQPLGPAVKPEAVKAVVFTFFNGELSRMIIDYDRYETEGLTPDDMIAAISATYGQASKPAVGGLAPPGQYADREEPIALWSNDQNSFELVRFSYGPSYRLIGVLKRLEKQAATASTEAAMLDAAEAPSREAARVAKQEEQDRTRLEQTRDANRSKFIP